MCIICYDYATINVGISSVFVIIKFNGNKIHVKNAITIFFSFYKDSIIADVAHL